MASIPEMDDHELAEMVMRLTDWFDAQGTHPANRGMIMAFYIAQIIGMVSKDRPSAARGFHQYQMMLAGALDRFMNVKEQLEGRS